MTTSAPAKGGFAMGLSNSRSGASHQPGNDWREPLTPLLLVVAVSLVVYCIRLQGIVHKGDLFDPLGHQGPPLYSIWKTQNGYPLYEWPDRDNYNVTLYNYSFYHVYALLLSAFGAKGQAIITACRLISIFFCLVGVAATLLLIVSNCPKTDSRGRWFAALMAFFVWFGTSPMGWWNVSIRPDLLALMCSCFGLLAYLKGVRGAELRWFVLASMLFFCTWSTKQSYIAIFFAVCLHALFCLRRWAMVLALAAPAGTLMAVSLLFGGEVYRKNMLWAPSISPFLFDLNGFGKIAKVVAANGFVWLFPLVFLVWGSVQRRRKIGEGEADADRPDEQTWTGLGPLVFASVFAVLWGSLAVFREGGEDNALLEAHLSLGVLSTVLLLRLRSFSGSSIVGVRLAPLLIISMLLYPGGQLLFRSAPMHVLSEEEYSKRQALVEWMSRLPKPIYVWDDMLSQPWFSSDNQYPAFVPDRVWMDIAARRNALQGGGINGLFDRRYFGSVILLPRYSGLIARATQAGYQRAPDGVPAVAESFVVLVRPDTSLAEAK